MSESPEIDFAAFVSAKGPGAISLGDVATARPISIILPSILPDNQLRPQPLEEKSELEKYLEISKEDLFKYVCFIPNHKFLYIDIKKNINLLVNEKILNDNSILLKYILNIQFNLLNIPKELVISSESLDDYNIQNLLSIISKLLQIDIENIPFKDIIELFFNKFTNKFDVILMTYINRYIDILFYTKEVVSITDEKINLMKDELKDERFRALDSDLYDKSSLKKLKLSSIWDETLHPLALEYNSIIDKYKKIIIPLILDYYNNHYNKDIFIDNLIILSESDKRFVTEKVDLYIKSRLSIDNLFDPLFPSEITPFIFYLPEDYIRILYDQVIRYINDFLSHPEVLDIYERYQQLMVNELEDPKFRQITDTFSKTTLMIERPDYFIDISFKQLLTDYNKIIEKYQKLVLPLILEYYNKYTKEIFDDQFEFSLSYQKSISIKVDLFIRSILNIDNLKTRNVQSLFEWEFLNPDFELNIETFFNIHENLEDECKYNAIKINLNKESILRVLSYEKDELKFNNLEWLNLRNIKNLFINEFITILFEFIENPTIVSCYMEIMSQISKTTPHISYSILMKDLDAFKQILTPILQKITNPIFNILQEIEKNKDISINGYILFIKYILNEFILPVCKFIDLLYNQNTKGLSKEIKDIMESSKIHQYINGTFDYTKLFKIKNIDIDYLFEIIKDCISKLMLLKQIMEAKAAATAAEAERKKKEALKGRQTSSRHQVATGTLDSTTSTVATSDMSEADL